MNLQVQSLARSAMTFLADPRPSHADGGARILALLQRKYVLGLGWQLDAASAHPSQPGQSLELLQNGGEHAQPATATSDSAAGGDRRAADGDRLAAGFVFLQQLCDRLKVGG